MKKEHGRRKKNLTFFFSFTIRMDTQDDTCMPWYQFGENQFL
jgi:hypothetical protein